jgi:RNA polymerase sigma factor (sigma-70 family)
MATGVRAMVGDVEFGFFEALMTTNLPLLRAYVRRLVRPADVDDVVSSVLLVAWRRRETCENADPRPWMFVTARKVAADVHRAERRRQRLYRSLEDAVSIRTEEPVETEHQVMEEALARLSDDDRCVLIDHYILDQPIDRLATQAGCTQAAMRKRLQRARCRLRALLADDRQPVDGATRWPDRAMGVRLT